MTSTSREPLVSVITPSYESGRFIRETISSVMAQTFPRWEMVIVDDCSKDDTAAIAQAAAAADERVRFVRSEVNRGPGPTRNDALRRARGRYVAFLDADDLWDPTKLERQVALMQRGGHAFSYTGYRVISEDGRPLGSAPPLPPTQTYRDLLGNTRIGCLTVMLDRDQLGAIEFPPYRRNQDVGLWLRLLRGGLVAHGVPEELATYRMVGTSNTSNKVKAAQAVWHVYREQERLSLAVASWYFAQYAWHAARKHSRWRLEDGRTRDSGARESGVHP